MYQLMVSRDCGVTYRLYMAAETTFELRTQMELLDGEGRRWYLEKDGEVMPGFICRRHAMLIAFIQTVQGEEANDA